MEIANIHEAKTQFSRLLERVENGEEIVIARAGKPVAKLVPFEAAFEPRTVSQCKGEWSIAPDFDRLPDDIAEAFGMLDMAKDVPS